MVGECPIVKGFGNRHCTDIKHQPRDNHVLEEYGEGSRCFEMDPSTNFIGPGGKNYKCQISKITKVSHRTMTTKSWPSNAAACYKFNCDNGTTINIVVHDQTLRCKQDGMKIDVNVTKDGSTHTGEIHESR